MQALGIDVENSISADASKFMAAGQSILQQLMAPVLRTLCYNDTRICLSCMPFLLAHLARVKNACKRQGGVEPLLRTQLLQIMEVTCLAVKI